MRTPIRNVIILAILASLGLMTASATSAGAATTAPHGTGFTTQATAYQNAVLTNAMATRPGGVRVSTREVKWPDGSFVIAATSASDATHPHKGAVADSTCLPNQFCGFTGSDLNGNEFAVGGTGWIPFGECSPTRYPGCDAGIASWENFKSVRVWLEQFKNGGNELCIDPYGDGNWTQGNYTGVDANDYWWLITTNTADC